MDILEKLIREGLLKSTGDSSSLITRGRVETLASDFSEAIEDFTGRKREVPKAIDGDEGDVITVKGGIYTLSPAQTTAQNIGQGVQAPSDGANFVNISVTEQVDTKVLDTTSLNAKKFTLKDQIIMYDPSYDTLKIDSTLLLGNVIHTFGHGRVENAGEYILMSDSCPFIVAPYTGYVDKITIGYNLLALLQAPRSFVINLEIEDKEYTIYEMTETNDPDDFTETLVIDSLDNASFPIDHLSPIKVKLTQNGYEITDITVALLCRITG